MSLLNVVLIVQFVYLALLAVPEDESFHKLFHEDEEIIHELHLMGVIHCAADHAEDALDAGPYLFPSWLTSGPE